MQWKFEVSIVKWYFGDEQGMNLKGSQLRKLTIGKCSQSKGSMDSWWGSRICMEGSQSSLSCKREEQRESGEGATVHTLVIRVDINSQVTGALLTSVHVLSLNPPSPHHSLWGSQEQNKQEQLGKQGIQRKRPNQLPVLGFVVVATDWARKVVWIFNWMKIWGLTLN